VVDHIHAHLAEELLLVALARVAAFSPFHFHRVFRAVTGETLFAFIQRLRLERSAGVLLAASDLSVLEVALDHGFASAATWMRARGFHQDATIRLGVAHDDPAITPAEKCRYDACLAIPEDFQPDRWVNVTEIPKNKYAVWEFTGTAHDIQAAWDRVFSAWLPNSGYQPDDRPCFEVYRGGLDVDAKAGIFRCELCLPVKAL